MTGISVELIKNGVKIVQKVKDPGFSLTSIYHTSVEAGDEVARAREIRIGRIPATLPEA